MPHYKAWGTVYNGFTIRGPCTVKQAKLHINSLELIWLVYALKSSVGRKWGLSIQIFLENTPVMG